MNAHRFLEETSQVEPHAVGRVRLLPLPRTVSEAPGEVRLPVLPQCVPVIRDEREGLYTDAAPVAFPRYAQTDPGLSARALQERSLEEAILLINSILYLRHWGKVERIRLRGSTFLSGLFSRAAVTDEEIEVTLQKIPAVSGESVVERVLYAHLAHGVVSRGAGGTAAELKVLLSHLAVAAYWSRS